MPRKKTTAPTDSSIFALLSPERRNEILQEVLGTQLGGLVAGSESVGSLVGKLGAHAHWAHLQHLPVSSLHHIGSGKAPASSTHAAPAPVPAARSIETAPAAPTAKPARKAQPKKRRPGINPEKVLSVLRGSKEPMPVSEVAKAIGETDVVRVRAALLKLRDLNSAKMAGSKSTAKWSVV